jgi:hypothetical protein
LCEARDAGEDLLRPARRRPVLDTLDRHRESRSDFVLYVWTIYNAVAWFDCSTVEQGAGGLIGVAVKAGDNPDGPQRAATLASAHVQATGQPLTGP